MTAASLPRFPPCRHEVDSIVVTNQSTKLLSFPHYTTFPDNAYLTLQVSRGRTRFPHRPVTVSRFTIGSGSGCDMVLGDAQIPPIHTILIIDGGRVLVEALTQAPLLKVNGNVDSGRQR